MFESYHQRVRESGVTGGLAEDDFIPTIACGWDKQKYYQLDDDKEAKRKMMKAWAVDNLPAEISSQWLSLSRDERQEALMDWVRGHQPEGWDITNPVRCRQNQVTGKWEPGNTMAADLKRKIQSNLQLHQNNIKLFTTAGTPLDSMGVDAFWEVVIEDGDEEIPSATLTLDYTENEDKLSGKVGSGSEYVFTIRDVPDPQAPEPERKKAQYNHEACLALEAELMSKRLGRKIKAAKRSVA